MEQKKKIAVIRNVACASRNSALKCLVAFLCALPAHTQTQSHPTVQQVEAAYLYNFAKFIQQPSSSQPDGSPVTICAMGGDDFDRVLSRTISGQTIDGRPVRSKNVKTKDDVQTCTILFVSDSAIDRVAGLWTNLRSHSVLTVSDAPDFLKRGGMIQFKVIDNRVRFEVNIDAAKSAGVQLSSELLKVALNIVEMPKS